MLDHKTILVTGGTGFIGRNITEFFGENAIILAPSHAQLDLLSQESVNAFFRDHDIDFVIHCASVGGNRKCLDVTDVVGKNTRMFYNLVGNSRRFEKFIHFGSGAEYDKTVPLHQIKEEFFGMRIPTDDYGFSKYLISKYIENAENIVCLRPFGVFGKYEDYEYKFISNAIVKNLLGVPIHIRQNVYFDWVYIDDLMRILASFLTKDSKYTLYNVTASNPTDLVTITNLIISLSTTHSDICVENSGLNNEYSGDNSRLMSQLGDFKFTPLPSAISELTKYYQSILTHIDSDVIRKDEYARRCVIQQG